MATLTKEFADARGDEAGARRRAPARPRGAEFDERVNRLVNGLRAAGLTTGDTIAVVVGNRREWFEIAMACAHGGWTYVPVNWHWVADELAYVFEDADVVAVVVDGRYVDAVAAALDDDRSTAVRLVVGIDAPSTGDDDDRSFVAYEDLLAGAPTDRARGPAARRSDVLHVGHDRAAEGRARLAARQQRPDAGDHAAGRRRVLGLLPDPRYDAAVRALLPLGPVRLLVPAA